MEKEERRKKKNGHQIPCEILDDNWCNRHDLFAPTSNTFHRTFKSSRDHHCTFVVHPSTCLLVANGCWWALRWVLDGMAGQTCVEEGDCFCQLRKNDGRDWQRRQLLVDKVAVVWWGARLGQVSSYRSFYLSFPAGEKDLQPACDFEAQQPQRLIITTRWSSIAHDKKWNAYMMNALSLNLHIWPLDLIK